jgi:hypothetical protein
LHFLPSANGCWPYPPSKTARIYIYFLKKRMEKTCKKANPGNREIRKEGMGIGHGIFCGNANAS